MKTYGNLRVPWHTHLYRSALALFVKSDRPWHAYFYRAFESLKRNPKYSPPSPEKILRDALRDTLQETLPPILETTPPPVLEPLLRDILHELKLPPPRDETGAILVELKRQRNRTNKTVLRHAENLSSPVIDVQTSYEFDHIADSLNPIITERSPTLIVYTVALGADYRKTIAPCLASHVDYCAKHGYSYAELSLPPNRSNRPLPWYKIPLGHHLLKLGYRHVFYLDADCLITNPDVRLETWIEKLDHLQSPRTMLLTEDESGINLGSFLLRNTPAAARLLDSIWLYDADVSHPLWEQEALKRLITDHEEFLTALAIEKNGKLFNSMPHERQEFHPSIILPVNVWTPGDFICHFSGIRSPHLERMITRYMDALKTP